MNVLTYECMNVLTYERMDVLTYELIARTQKKF